jgi:hypothetical protein
MILYKINLITLYNIFDSAIYTIWKEFRNTHLHHPKGHQMRNFFKSADDHIILEYIMFVYMHVYVKISYELCRVAGLSWTSFVCRISEKEFRGFKDTFQYLMMLTKSQIATMNGKTFQVLLY